MFEEGCEEGRYHLLHRVAEREIRWLRRESLALRTPSISMLSLLYPVFWIYLIQNYSNPDTSNSSTTMTGLESCYDLIIICILYFFQGILYRPQYSKLGQAFADYLLFTCSSPAQYLNLVWTFKLMVLRELCEASFRNWWSKYRSFFGLIFHLSHDQFLTWVIFLCLTLAWPRLVHQGQTTPCCWVSSFSAFFDLFQFPWAHHLPDTYLIYVILEIWMQDPYDQY